MSQMQTTNPTTDKRSVKECSKLGLVRERLGPLAHSSTCVLIPRATELKLAGISEIRASGCRGRQSPIIEPSSPFKSAKRE